MANDTIVQERVQELTWALVDEQIADDEVRLLENLLLSDETARRTYVDCIQLHTDLMFHYAKPSAEPTATSASGSPILGLPTTGVMPFSAQSPSAEDAAM